MVKNFINNEIKFQISADFNTLYVMLASSSSIGSVPPSVSEGERIYKKVRDYLHKKICDNQAIKELRSKSSVSKIDVACAVFDVISDLIFDFSPVTVSVLIAKHGLDSMCVEN
jgi:hypothetical protein